MIIPLIKPYISDKVKNKVIEVLESGFLTEGETTHEFEKKFREYTGSKHAIAVTSCTTGLEVALRALNIGAGDEVIVPDYTYPATASVVHIVGAKAVIIDVNKNNMLIDYDAINMAITPNTKAIIPVSLFGNPLNYDILNKIKVKYNIKIIEDSSGSIGSEFKNIKTGNLADISVFSFHPRKFITTGEGGMITTNDDNIADWMNSYKHFGMVTNIKPREEIRFIISGTNYKLSNILAAVGLEQLKEIEILLSKRRILAENYIRLLKETDIIKIPEVTENGFHSYQSFVIYINNRNKVLKELRNNNIEVQIGTYSLHMHQAFNKSDSYILLKCYPGSTYAYENSLTLPLYHELKYEQQKFIIQSLLKYLKS